MMIDMLPETPFAAPTVMRRRRRAALAAVLCAVFAASASGQEFPSRPIKLIVGFAPGSASDALARPYGDKLAEVLKSPVVIDNKPGGQQAAAIQAVTMAPADGYTLYMGSGSSMAQGPGLRKDVRHDPLKNFTLIGYMASAPGAVLVNAELPVKTVEELIAYAKANPGKLTYGSSGVGSAGHLAGELFIALTGAKMLHIPYKADTEAAREVGSGTLQVAFTTLRTAANVVNSGKLRAVMVLDTKRTPLLPEVPHVAEVKAANLKDMSPYTWYALVGPANMPAAIVKRLSEASAKALSQPDLAGMLQQSGVNPEPSTPDGLRAITTRELAKWREVAKTVKID